MKKKLVIFNTILVFSFVVSFLLGAFTEWELNPGLWNIQTRSGCAFLGIFCGIFIALTGAILSDYKLKL